MAIIIGLSGKMGSGKDTLGEILVKKFGFVRVAFADYLKDHCRKYHSWNGLKDDAGRRLLQLQGTEVHRNADPDIWTKYAKLDIQMLKVDGFDRVVITDMRFPNEYDFVKSMAGYTVRIDGRVLDMGEEAAKHRSEVALDKHSFDYTVHNSGDIENLEEEADKLLEYCLVVDK